MEIALDPQLTGTVKRCHDLVCLVKSTSCVQSKKKKKKSRYLAHRLPQIGVPCIETQHKKYDLYPALTRRICYGGLTWDRVLGTT